MTTIIAGFDPGNSEATFIAGTRQRTIPSYIGSGTRDELLRIRGGGGASAALGDGELVLEMNGVSTFVGSLALQQSADADSGRGDVARYWSGHSTRLLLALAGAAIRERKFALRVVTGLPVKVWSSETKQKVQQALVGTHRFVLNGVEREATVEAVAVMMEGAGALAVVGSAEPVPQAVIDVGGRTSDLFWAEGQRPVLPRCAGVAVGVERISDQLGARFARDYGRELTPAELRGVLRAYAAGAEPPAIYVDGERAHLNGEVGELVASVGSEIASFASRTWGSGERGKVASEAAKVLLIGGGAYYFAERLKAAIPHLQVPSVPELANARGYLAVGQQLSEDVWARQRG